MIDKATIQKIKDTADIVEVVGDYVHLIRKGANYMGLCPFHNERTPSFSVNKARNFCYCFSCHKGGAPVNFIMEKEGISYYDALRQLAKKYGIKIEERELTDEEKAAQSKRESMFVANEWAMNFFEENLNDTEEGRNIGLTYFYGRGVTQEAIKQFHLGYSPNNGSEFLNAAIKKGFNIALLKEVGLIGTSQRGNDYDKYHGRVIFPILNSSGKVIGFGGRDLKGVQPKYINSPESEIYKKSNELYGLFQAKNSIARENKCYLVEGYLDVIGMWQNGLKNTVASSGTALTDGQIALIHRFTKNVTLIYDGDNAGIKASLRGIDMLLAHKLDLKVVLLPEGEDPDSWSRKLSAEEFRNYIRDNETDMIQFKAKVLMKEALNDPQKRVEAINSVITSLAHIPEKVKRDIYIQECSRILNISESAISLSLARLQASIVDQEKRKREHQTLETDLASGKIPPSPSSGETTPETPNNNIDQRVARTFNNIQNNKLRKLEWEVLLLCIKSGYISLIESENEEEEPLTTIEFIADELKIDEIEFSQSDFSHIFNVILDSIPKYKDELNELKNILDVKSTEKRKEGYDKLAEKNLTVAEIEIEEKNLENEIAGWIHSELENFAATYPYKFLASHIDDTVRSLANEALHEKYKLSNFYLKNQESQEDDNRLLKLVLNALNVLKNGLLNLQLEKLMAKLSQCQDSPEESLQIHNRIQEIISIRNSMAKDLGERIVCPPKS